eukprot:TRINITY_DN29429_c0_g1_i1.p1 TRINITY_DN29429_c0_g1~~TRINITY_DN29429_c0_g1_i1.p1  ORF type:complete len:353 (+),score=82.75 TRINITY_DN29429_c0_g1_i1:54-1112(+)
MLFDVAIFIYRFLFIFSPYCSMLSISVFFFFQAEDGIRDAQESRGLGDVYKRQEYGGCKDARMIRDSVIVLGLALGAAWVLGHLVALDPKLPSSAVIGGERIEFARGANNVLMIRARNSTGWARGLGFGHCWDRFVQMDAQRTAARGKLSERYGATPSSIQMDFFFRSAQLGGRALRTSHLDPAVLALLEDYADGINFWIEQYGQARPIEFIRMWYWTPRWELEDTLAVVELPSFLAAIEQQGALEKQVMLALKRNSSSLGHLKAVFPQLEKMPNLPQLATAHIRFPRLPKEARSYVGLPWLLSGNAWAVSGSISRSCLLYTSDAADEEDSVDLGGRRIIKKKKKKNKHKMR